MIDTKRKKDKIKILAYGKINLFLEVVKKREDGYHEVITLLQSIDLGDEIKLELRDDKNIKVISNIDTLLPSQKNIAYQAATLLRKKTKIQKGITIFIQKNIPIGAGLGGGSADAAAVLKGCNQLWELNLTPLQLAEIGAEIGCDVPFLLEGGTALAVGKGEKIIKKFNTPLCSGVIVFPGFSISTEWVYRQLDSNFFQIHSKENKIKKLENLIFSLQNNDLQGIAKNLFNRLESVVFSHFPQLIKIKKLLISLGCIGASMSGSGSAIFGLTETFQQAMEICLQMQKKEKVWIMPIKFMAHSF